MLSKNRQKKIDFCHDMRINSDWRNCIRHRFRLNGHRTHIDRDSEMCVCKTSFIFKFTFNESVCIIKQYRVLKNVRVSLINCNTYGWVSKWCVTHHYMVEWCYLWYHRFSFGFDCGAMVRVKLPQIQPHLHFQTWKHHFGGYTSPFFGESNHFFFR